jgi:hypothetical protein
MRKKLTEISPSLTIPGFHVKVENPHSCKVQAKDGQHKFSADIIDRAMIISGPTFPTPLGLRIGLWKAVGCQFATDADNSITHVANSLKLMDKLSNDGFLTKIDKNWLVLSHPSKPDYSLCMSLTGVRKVVPLKNTSLYTGVTYCGPAYDEEPNKKWKQDWWVINNFKLIVIDKDLEKFSQNLKTRVLNLGEPDHRIYPWVNQNLEHKLLPQGVIFTPIPEKGVVEFSHPVGLSGSLSFAPFTAGLALDLKPKFPNPHFPTDLEPKKVVLFTCNRPKCREPYAKALLADEPQDAISHIQKVLALRLVYQEVCNAWKSSLLVPKLQPSKLLLVNPKLDGDKSIILALTPEKDKLLLKGMGEQLSYPTSNTPIVIDTKKITQVIVNLAEKHVQEFIQANGLTTKITEIDF